MSPHPRRDALATARSLLFVPGNRPDRFDKADASSADVVILDLEDAVPPAEKETARHHVVEWAASHPRCIVRLNGVGTPWLTGDLAALKGSGVPVMLPKADNVDELRRVEQLLGESSVIGLVETPRGVAAAMDVAASGAVCRLALGNVDLGSMLGVDPASHSALLYARGALVMASAAAGLPAPVDGVTTRFNDEAALEADVAHGREMGFGGKLCIHPRQLAVVNIGLSPTPDELDWAQRVLAQAVDGVSGVDGSMVDAPVLARARTIVARADWSRDGSSQ